MSTETATPRPNSLTPADFEFTQTHILSKYVTDTGKILPRKLNGLNAKNQRRITRLIKQARNTLLMQ